VGCVVGLVGNGSNKWIILFDLFRVIYICRQWYICVLSGEVLPPRLTREVSALNGQQGSYVLHINKVTAECKETLQVGLTRALGHLEVYMEMFGLPKFSVEVHELMIFFHSCEAQFVRGNAEKAARAAAEGFAWEEAELDRDGSDLLRLGSVSALVLERRNANNANRFNAERCQKYFSDVSNADVLMDLAVWGARLPVASDFVFQATPEKPRALQKKLGLNYSKQVKKLWDKGF